MREPRDPFDLCGVTIDGKYRVASVIGDGGFGVVYRGVHKGFGELIAIKCLKLPSELDEKGRADFLERLQDEGRLLHRLSKATSGIVQALDVGAFTAPSGAWVPYLILEWLEGETLAQFLKTRVETSAGGISLDEAIRMLAPAARALAVAHAQKIAHRDVKPANLILTEVGGKRTTKVLDFGIAKVLADNNTFTTALESTGIAPTAFTPRYGAPEQFNKQRGASGPWTDVFALALVLVECVSGKRALEGDDPTQLYIASADPAMRPTLRRRGIDASDEVEAVLRKALEIEPRERYADAALFWDALEAAAGVDSEGAVNPRMSRPTSTERDPEPDPLLDTEAYAAKRSIKVDSVSAKTSMGPTVPVESLRQVPQASDKPPSRKSRPSTAADPMAETPEGLRVADKLATSSTKSSTPEAPQKSSAIWTLLALLVFAGGATFAYVTFFGGDRPKDKLVPSAHASASSKVEPPKIPSAKPRASSAPSAQPVASVDAIVDGGVPTDATLAIATPANMTRIAATTFSMGENRVKTRVSRDFFIDQYEVSFRNFKECLDDRKCPKADRVMGTDPADSETWSPRCSANRKKPDDPMNCVDAKAAEAFCAYKGKRLPTEAEWELAARGPNGRKHSWGAGAAECSTACYGLNGLCLQPGGEVAACEVGKHKDDATPDGIFDLAGNVAEWTADGFSDALPGGNDPRVPANDTRAVRGGSFVDNAALLDATTRRSVAADEARVDIGLRCAQDADAPQASTGSAKHPKP